MPRARDLVQGAVDLPHVTVEHLLCNPLAGSTLESLSEQGLAEILNRLLHSVAPPVWNGNQLLNRLRTTANIVPTGCASVDTLLNGGLREGHLTELYGESAAGKTQVVTLQLCTMAAVASAMRGDHVLYIDTTRSFSSRRAAAIYHGLRSRQQDDKPLLEILSNIQVTPAHTVHEALAVLDTVALTMQGMLDQNVVCQPKLIVLDSVSALITPILGAGGSQQSQGHALMSGLGHLLKYIGAQYTTAMLCTNHMVGSGTNPRPALGESWKNQPHTRVQLIRPDVGDDRHVVISASATAACNQQAMFRLT